MFQSIEDLLTVSDLILEGIVYRGIFRRDDKAKLIQNVKLTGAHSFDRVRVRQRANLIRAEDIRQLTVKIRVGVIERSVFTFLKIKAYVISQDPEAFLILVLIHKRRRFKDLRDSFAHFTRQSSIRSD